MKTVIEELWEQTFQIVIDRQFFGMNNLHPTTDKEYSEYNTKDFTLVYKKVLSSSQIQSAIRIQ